MSATVAALVNCFRQTVGNCLVPSNPQQMSAAAIYSRQLQLLGVTDPEYNVLNEALYCREGWVGTTTRWAGPAFPVVASALPTGRTRRISPHGLLHGAARVRHG